MNKYFNNKYLKKYHKITLSLLPFLAIIAIYYIIISPNDYQQQSLIKIMYLHVPFAWISMLSYCCLAIISLIFIVTNYEIYGILHKSLIAICANSTAITLFCGSIWGQKSWGNWWVWDPRIISELILFGFIITIMAVRQNFNNNNHADFACAILTLIGAIDLPIIKFSVEWYNSLHQRSSLAFTGNHINDKLMLMALLSSFAFFAALSLLFFINNTKIELLKRAQNIRHNRLLRQQYRDIKI